jgi:alkaline phosphatase D
VAVTLFEMVGGVIAVSGDRHLAEISILPPDAIGYSLYEITSSGLNSAMGTISQGRNERNRLRSGENVLVDNFGAIRIVRRDAEVELRLQIRDDEGRILREKVVPLASLKRGG